MNGPELLKEVMIRELKAKAIEEEELADDALRHMTATSGLEATKYSEIMKKHRYACQQFRKMVKIMEAK